MMFHLHSRGRPEKGHPRKKVKKWERFKWK